MSLTLTKSAPQGSVALAVAGGESLVYSSTSGFGEAGAERTALRAAPEAEVAYGLPPGREFQILPELRPKVAQHIHIAAPSGHGKSTWAGAFARRFKQLLGGQVVVVSADGDEDPAIKADVRMAVNAQTAPTFEATDLGELSRANGGRPILFVFDDIEGLPKALSKSLDVLRHAVHERGRKHGISSINIFHKGAAGPATRTSLNEATAFVVFPEAGLSKNTRYMLENYANTPTSLISTIRKNPAWGRWVYITTTHPQVAIGERRAILIDPEEIEALAAELRTSRRAAVATQQQLRAAAAGRRTSDAARSEARNSVARGKPALRSRRGRRPGASTFNPETGEFVTATGQKVQATKAEDEATATARRAAAAARAKADLEAAKKKSGIVEVSPTAEQSTAKLAADRRDAARRRAEEAARAAEEAEREAEAAASAYDAYLRGLRGREFAEGEDAGLGDAGAAAAP